MSASYIGRRDGMQATEFDFPRPLLDRLLASEIVPLQAKIEAIRSWRGELAQAHSLDPRTRELQHCLAKAHWLLRRQRLTSAVAAAAARISQLIRFPLRSMTSSSEAHASE
jgi:hypothetical protein